MDGWEEWWWVRLLFGGVLVAWSNQRHLCISMKSLVWLAAYDDWVFAEHGRTLCQDKPSPT